MENLFFHSAGGQKSEIRDLAELLSSEAFLVDMQMTIFCLSVFTCSFLCAYVCQSLLYRDASHVGLEPIPIAFFNLITSFNIIPNTVTFDIHVSCSSLPIIFLISLGKSALSLAKSMQILILVLWYIFSQFLQI